MPGTYRLSFHAKALNRSFVSKAFDEINKNSKHPTKDLRAWDNELIHQQAVLSLYHEGQQVSQWYPAKSGGYVFGAKPGRLLHNFVIEDNKEKKYTAEFTLEENAKISLSFANGPVFPRRQWIRLGKYGIGKSTNQNHPFPRVEITKEITLEKLSNIESLSAFDISEKDREDDYVAKLQGLAKELRIPVPEKYVKDIYDSFPPTVYGYRRYLSSLTYLILAPENLFLDYNDSDPAAKARYVSYALLKRQPDEKFEEMFQKLRREQIDEHSFVSYLMKEAGFKDFIEEFSHHWIEDHVKLDIVKYNEKIRNQAYKQQLDNYLEYLLKENRPIKEIFVSNYQFLDSSFASFYEPEIKGLNKLSRGEFKKVKHSHPIKITKL